MEKEQTQLLNELANKLSQSDFNKICRVVELENKLKK